MEDYGFRKDVDGLVQTRRHAGDALGVSVDSSRVP